MKSSAPAALQISNETLPIFRSDSPFIPPPLPSLSKASNPRCRPDDRACCAADLPGESSAEPQDLLSRSEPDGLLPCRQGGSFLHSCDPMTSSPAAFATSVPGSTLFLTRLIHSIFHPGSDVSLAAMLPPSRLLIIALSKLFAPSHPFLVRSEEITGA
jgi:hypothetical protein